MEWISARGAAGRGLPADRAALGPARARRRASRRSRRRRRRGARRELREARRVLPGCRLPTSRHVDSAYCCKTHADQDDDGAIAAAAGYKRDGAPFEHTATDRLLGGASGGAPPEALRSLELLVCHAALPRGWAYPRAPPRIALRCAGSVKRRAAPRARARAPTGDRDREGAADAPAAGCDLLSWLARQYLLQRLSCHPLERPPAVEEKKRRRRRGAGRLALARKNVTTRRKDVGGAASGGLRGERADAGGIPSRSRCAAKGTTVRPSAPPRRRRWSYTVTGRPAGTGGRCHRVADTDDARPPRAARPRPWARSVGREAAPARERR